jgi:hypothetical protein
VEKSCYKCGANIEEGVPFCPHCGAPQIRVEAPVVEPSYEAATAAVQVAGRSGAVRWSDGLPSAALGGMIAAAAMVIPLGGFGLGIVAAGGLTVIFYQRRRPGDIMTTGMGARLGAATGAIGFGIFSIVMAAGTFMFHAGGQLRAKLLEAIEQSAARAPDSEARQMMETFKTPEGLALLFVASLIFLLAFFLLFSSLGGAVGGSFARRGNQR